MTVQLRAEPPVIEMVNGRERRGTRYGVWIGDDRIGVVGQVFDVRRRYRAGDYDSTGGHVVETWWMVFPDLMRSAGDRYPTRDEAVEALDRTERACVTRSAIGVDEL